MSNHNTQYNAGDFIDLATLGIDTTKSVVDHIEVTASNTYWLYTTAGKYRPAYLYKGIPYSGRGIVKATDSAGSALTAGIMYFVY